MADIFISYSSRERSQAKNLVDRLRKQGFSCWIDESGINAASEWSSEIVKGIEACRVFIVLLSHSSIASHNVIKELSLASEEKKHIIPIDLEQVNLSHRIKYQLAGLQRVPYKNYERIEEAVRRFIGEGEQPAESVSEMKRHLVAVMFTDIQGYSKIMNVNEALALEILHFHNAFLRQTIERNGGRVVEIIGDAFLAVFESAVRAVEAGITIQDGLKEHNATRPQEKRFLVRIGIHMGDIIEEGSEIKGDTVNIAARIQSIAPGGGVAISETIYDAVKRKMQLDVVSLGEKKLKNIEDLYTIYSLKQFDGQNPVARTLSPSAGTDGQRVRPTGDFTIDAPTKRLAVIPFEDQSPNHDNEWFGDGLTDDLISTLNKLDDVFVLDSQSTKEYRNSRLSTKQIAQELAVRYIITGSVRKQEKNIRVQATLIDTQTGITLWDEKFPGTMDDIFDIQEKTAKDIAEGLKLKLTPQEKKEIEKKLTENAEAYELYLLGLDYASCQTKQDFLYAIKLYNSAMELDPTFASAYARITSAYTDLYRLYDRKPEYLELAESTAKKALELDPGLSDVYRAFSSLSVQQGLTEEAIEYAKKAVELEPKRYINYFQLGFIYSETDHPSEAALCYEESLKLEMNSLAAHLNLCVEYDRLGDKEMRGKAAMRAVPYYERHLRKHPDDQTLLMHYAILLEFSGKIEQSLTEIEHIISLPNADGLTLYNAACTMIRQGRTKQGIQALERAVRAGFTSIKTFRTDPDLDPIRAMPEFQEIMKKLEQWN